MKGSVSSTLFIFRYKKTIDEYKWIGGTNSFSI